MPLQLREPDLGVARQTDAVVIVQLDFGARTRPGQNTVVGHQRTVDRRRYRVARIAAPYRNVAVHQTDPCHAAPRSVFLRPRLARRNSRRLVRRLRQQRRNADPRDQQRQHQ